MIITHSLFFFLFFLLSFQHPAEAPEFSADLPVPLVIAWTSQVPSPKLLQNFFNRNIVTEKLIWLFITLPKLAFLK